MSNEHPRIHGLVEVGKDDGSPMGPVSRSLSVFAYEAPWWYLLVNDLYKDTYRWLRFGPGGSYIVLTECHGDFNWRHDAIGWARERPQTKLYRLHPDARLADVLPQIWETSK